MTVADRMIERGRVKRLVDAVLVRVRAFDDAQLEGLCQPPLDPALEAEAIKAFHLSDDTKG